MEQNNFTRESLFKEAADIISEKKGSVEFKNADIVINLYYNSAKLLHGFEGLIISNNLMEEKIEFNHKLIENLDLVNDPDFVLFVKNHIKTQQSSRLKKSSTTYKENFKYLLKAITDYQEKIIDEQYIGVNNNFRKVGLPQTFLSYAYYDKGLSLSLFYFFFSRGGFLYVNWMWQGLNSSGTTTKIELEKELFNSNQLLFLRTTNSELHLRGNNSIRQWCSWEIGNFYTKKCREKYYTNFYEKAPPKNDILDSFSAIIDVVGGRCVK